MECPNCEYEGPFEDNGGEVNHDLTYLCPACGEQFDVVNCDGCKQHMTVEELVTDEAPFLCQTCLDKKGG